MTANLNTIFQSHENVALRSYFDSQRRVINTGKLYFVNDIFAHSMIGKKYPVINFTSCFISRTCLVFPFLWQPCIKSKYHV